MNRVKKAMVIGLDAPIPKRIHEYAMEGKLPTFARLIREGVWGDNCLVPLPTITPPNWTTIATGATIGTHGIACFNIRTPGNLPNELHQAFNSAEVRAEFIWNAIERVGKKAIIVNYPTSWPPTIKHGYQIAGAGLAVNEWRAGPAGESYPPEAGLANIKFTLAYAQLLEAEDLPATNRVELKEASGWKNMPRTSKALEADLRLGYPQALFPVREKIWWMLVVDPSGNGYDRILLSKTKDAAEAFASLSVGQWTKNIVDIFETEKGPAEAAFRCKLLRLSPDGRELRLYVTPICALSGWSYPESLAREIRSEEGLPMPISAAFLIPDDADTIIEAAELHHVWLADAAAYLLKNKEWDLYYMHIHTPDTMYHRFSTRMDPATAGSSGEAEFWQGVELALYQSMDRALCRILSAVNEDETLIIITSDHGAKATTQRFTVLKILADNGLLFLKAPEAGAAQVDWSKTKAIQTGSCYVSVNLKGREPQGIVEPGEEYERICDQMIRALYEYKDPVTGKSPISLALKREDARVIGLHGEMVGDVVFAVSGDFGGQHGPHLPTTEFSLGSLKGLLIMKGPGIKKNFVMKRTAWLWDIVPTICHLMEIPIPRDAEGAVLYQALEDPDAKMKELQELRWKHKN